MNKIKITDNFFLFFPFLGGTNQWGGGGGMKNFAAGDKWFLNIHPCKYLKETCLNMLAAKVFHNFRWKHSRCKCTSKQKVSYIHSILNVKYLKSNALSGSLKQTFSSISVNNYKITFKLTWRLHWIHCPDHQSPS